jgi:hypothetical protein
MPISVWQRRDGTQYCRAAPTLRRTPRLVVGVDALGGAYCLGQPGDEHGPDRRLMTCFPYLQGVDVSIEAWNRRWRKLRAFASSCAVPRSHRLRMLEESFFLRDWRGRKGQRQIEIQKDFQVALGSDVCHCQHKRSRKSSRCGVCRMGLRGRWVCTLV